jgi:hypothetical protein
MDQSIRNGLINGRKEEKTSTIDSKSFMETGERKS